MKYANALYNPKFNLALKEMLISEDLCYQDLDDIKGILEVAFDSSDTIIGGYGLEIFGKDALIRSVIINKEYRGSGKGKSIVVKAIEKARGNGVRQLYLLTTTADKFFVKFGFEEIPRNSVPESIAGTTEFKTFCPDTAVCMKYEV